MERQVSYGYKKIAASEKRRLVRDHFDSIALRYDLADTLLSFGLHFLWRRRALDRLRLRPGDRMLDLCAGTADFAVQAAGRIGPGGQTVACDISREMMEVGRKKALRAGVEKQISWVQGDAEGMGFCRHSFDAVMVGYGIRNFVFLEQGLLEIHRVLKPGGRFVAMEFSVPETPWFRALYRFYSFRIMPGAGRLITGTADPFKYLAESIRVFPAPYQIRAMLTSCGFAEAGFEPMSNGLATLHFGKKPGSQEKITAKIPVQG
ncbi:ubiquinone/menaquinone biosynthesis methyltransferase [Desulfonatronospira sp.]|uniref:ubiquinone/menaquinone biosynthesis methyltransferase n=1 Tax=Desulfonatronospira sp. TaxID=1962951 RepID=UPI0025BDF6A6|nr:ubiquinone/menaquinone biosynthesis methyltransferase [Desulfonatronospira sp.]